MLELVKDNKELAKLQEGIQIRETEFERQNRINRERLEKVAESRKNMRLDMRPSVFLRIMNKELIVFGFFFVSFTSFMLFYYQFNQKKHLGDKFEDKEEEEMMLELMKEDYEDLTQSRFKEARFSRVGQKGGVQAIGPSQNGEDRFLESIREQEKYKHMPFHER